MFCIMLVFFLGPTKSFLSKTSGNSKLKCSCRCRSGALNSWAFFFSNWKYKNTTPNPSDMHLACALRAHFHTIFGLEKMPPFISYKTSRWSKNPSTPCFTRQISFRHVYSFSRNVNCIFAPTVLLCKQNFTHIHF